MRSGRLFLFVLGCLYSFFSWSQQFPFANYSVQNGLVSPRARSLFQDSKGRLYIASYGGLSVFDGARFTNYTTENGLASNMVNDVVEMGEDSLWILTNTNKINCLVHGKLKELTTANGFCPIINKLIKYANDFYYALTDEGLFRLEKNRFSKVPLKTSSGKPVNRYFVEGQLIKNKLFIITDPGVFFYPSPSYLIIYDLITHKTIISNKPPDFYAVVTSPRNDILIATTDGVKMLDTLALQHGNIQFGSLPAIYEKAAGIFARHLFFDHYQNLWLSTDMGVYKVDSHGKMVLFSTGNGLPANDYQAVFEDREHSMWLISGQAGISKLTNTRFEWYPYVEKRFIPRDIYADQSNDTVWLTDWREKNIIRLVYPGGSKEFIVKDMPERVNMVFRSNHLSYLIGRSAFYQLQNFSNSGTVEAKMLFSLSILQGPGITACLSDKSGNPVFVSDKLYASLPGQKIQEYPLDYLADQFFITKDNYLWVVTRSYTLYVFLLHPERPGHYFELIKKYNEKELPKLSPRAITVDLNGNVWIGNRDQGLFCFYLDKNRNIRSWQQITTKNGLSDNTITYLYCDDKGTIWSGTTSGLDKVGLKDNRPIVENITRSVTLYSHVEKIQTDRTGKLWILTHSGIITMYPPQVPEQIETKIFFTEVKAGKDTFPNNMQHLVLSYKQNDLTFQLAAPSFLNEKQTRFSYRLLGSNNSNWSEPLPNADIHFQNLAPGKYTLEAKAIFLNGYYQDTMTAFSFEVLPPWWQTWWFRVLQAMAVGVIVLMLAKYYTNRKLEKQRIVMEKQQALEKERARIASDMHDDLGAGLSSIRFLSEKVKRYTNDVTKNDVEKMADISLELIENMNEIIWAMNEKNDTLEDLLYYTRSYAKEYCEENQLDCQISFPESIPEKFVSGEFRRNIFLIVKESLHNIVKYAEASQVFISIKVNDHLELLISDNGKGFSSEMPESTSSGNGLRNMKKRIESIGGMLVLSNNPGACVHMQAPLQKPFLLLKT